MAQVLDVAKYILQKQGRMTPMKLQKLVYYAQVSALVDDEPLFADALKAWEQGPVVPTLFHAHKGRAQIDESAIVGDSSRLADAERARIDGVLAFYGNMSARYLSDRTHRERPWIEARAHGERHGHESPTITPAAIRAFYAGKTLEQLDADFKLEVAKELMRKHRESLARLAL
jgi:uncharacterized phage-associated protein